MSIHKSLIEFHKRFHGAKKTGFNPHFKQEHFTLEDVNDAIGPLLSDLGLFVAHRIVARELVTSIYNADGEEFSTALPLPESGNPQATGSAITYYKRYNLCALLNISEADDDGEAAAIDHLQSPRNATLAELERLAADNADRAKWLKAQLAKGMTDAAAQQVINEWKKRDKEKQAA